MDNQDIIENSKNNYNDFEKVNLLDSKSIMNYGQDITNSIITILDLVYKLVGNYEEISFSDATFNSFENATISENNTNKNSFLSGIKKFLGIKTKEEFTKVSDSDDYQNYCLKISKVFEEVEKQKQVTMNDIVLRETIIKEMNTYIEKLEQIITIGHNDRNIFDKDTLNLSALDQTIDIQYQIQNRNQMSEIFYQKLLELEKAVMTYKITIQNFLMQQNSDLNLVFKYDSYLKATAPILKTQKTIMIFNKINQSKNMQINSLNKEVSIENINATNSSNENNEEQQSLTTLETSLKAGLSIYLEGQKKRNTQIENNKEEISKINASQTINQQKLSDLIDDSINYTTINGNYQKKKN